MAERYTIHSGPAPTTASFAVVALVAATIKSILVVKLGASQTLRGIVVAWGVSFDAAADAAKVKCELITTDVAATVTAHVAAGIVNDDPLATAPTDDFPFDLSANTTGYNASAEGTITATRPLDVQHVSPAGAYAMQFPLGREKGFKAADFLRIRCNAPAAVNVYGFVVVEV